MASPSVFPAGTRLARYTTESVIGRGGMSVVYAAYDRRLGRPVALKVMAPPVGEEGDRFRKRFLRESRLAASIDHPNVIPIYDAGEADARLYIAMRLVQGIDLRLLLRREGPLHLTRALAIVAQAADALDAAHRRGLLHRDVKPGNILLASDKGVTDYVYLSDFGLAVPGGGERSLEGSGFHGTPEYVAPEQIEGRPEPRSDVYALACVLFECLAGEPPFGRGRLFETLWRHLNEEPPRLSDRLTECPMALDAVFAAALAKDPRERPTTCGELVSRARAAIGLGQPPRGHRARFVGAIAGLLAVASALAVALFLRGENKPLVAASTISQRGKIVTLAGTGERGSTGDGGPALRATLAEPSNLAVDRGGNVYVAEVENGRVRRVDRDGVITTVARIAAVSDLGVDLGVDSADRLYILGQDHPALERLNDRGEITVVAGTGNAGYLANGLRTVSHDLCSHPSGPAFDRAGNAYISCALSNRIIRIEPSGVYTTVAGSGEAGYSGDNGPATRAALNRPMGIAIDRRSNLYIADMLNNRVRMVDQDGIIRTFAGTGRPGFSADGWRASSIDIWNPTAVAVDAVGNVYIVEALTHRVRRVDPNGFITTIAGTGKPGFSGDAGPADRANLQDPSDVAADTHGNVYIVDSGNNRIRKVTP
jgi:sugar lactone lactonase YvrE